MFYVYVIRSLKNGNLYKGSTEDIEKWLNQHNLGKVSSAKGHRPWVMVHFEKFETRAEAVAREKYWKSGVGREYLRSIGL